jgi:hypothetical protein
VSSVMVGPSEADCRVSAAFGDVDLDIHGRTICDSRFQTWMLRSVPCGGVTSVGVYFPCHGRNECVYSA